MQFKFCLASVLLCGSVVLAQNQTAAPAQAPAAPAQAPAAQPAAQPAKTTPTASSSSNKSAAASSAKGNKDKAFVRRLSVGATLSVVGFSLVGGNSTEKITTTPPVDATYTTTGKSQRIGGGIMAQLSLTERFALSAGLFYRKAGYIMNGDVFTGTRNPVTGADNRVETVTNEDTRAKYYDLPLALRWYGKDRHDPGSRWFVEGGGVFRRVSSIRTGIDTTIGSGATSCCATTPIEPKNRTATGVLTGAGLQFIDPFGIRVMPGFRYTRWMTDTFSNFSTTSQRNQLEAMITLSF